MILRDYQTNLINATRNAFRTGSKAPCVVLPCGGGKTVCFAYMASEHIRKIPNGCVWFLVHRRELIDQTTETFKRFGLDTDNIFIGMVQTISRHPEKYRKPTMIIFDEAHHATAKTWTNITDFFKGVPIIGLSATPARTDGTGLGKVFDTIVEGVTAKWLIDNGFLCDYDYYAPKLNADYTLKKRGSDYDMQDVAEQFAKAKIYGDILKYIDQKRKTIIYCPTIEFSQALAEQIPNSAHFDGNTNKIERAKIVKQFRSGEIRVLLNVDLIGEGFDVPDCDCVILLRPTQSTILYIQQSMRCLRPAPNKRAAIIDMVGNCFRHGLPTEPREWSLTGRVSCRNESAEPDILVRQCKSCLRVYSGTSRICPYCGTNNGLTRKEIEQDKKAELERIEKIERKQKKDELKEAGQSLETLRAYGYKMGYAQGWAWQRWQILNKYKERYGR